jgi:hypothetical protein
MFITMVIPTCNLNCAPSTHHPTPRYSTSRSFSALKYPCPLSTEPLGENGRREMLDVVEGLYTDQLRLNCFFAGIYWGFSIGFNSWEFMGLDWDFMRFDGDLIGFHGHLLGIWHIPRRNPGLVLDLFILYMWDIPSIFVGLFLRVCSVSGLLLQWYTVSYMFLWLEDVLHIDSHWFPQDHVGFVNISSGPFRLLPSECCLVLQVLATHLSDSSLIILL